MFEKTPPHVRVLKHFGSFSEKNYKNERKEFTLTQWYNNTPKYDLRTWKEEDEDIYAPKNGFTLSEDALLRLYNLLDDVIDDIRGTQPNAKMESAKTEDLQNQLRLAQEKLRKAEATIKYYEKTQRVIINQNIARCCYPSCNEPIYMDEYCRFHYAQEKYESK